MAACCQAFPLMSVEGEAVSRRITFDPVCLLPLREKVRMRGSIQTSAHSFAAIPWASHPPL